MSKTTPKPRKGMAEATPLRSVPCPMPRLTSLVLSLLLAVAGLTAQDRTFTVMAYNVENLFDADEVSLYADFPATGDSPHRWTPEKLSRKLSSIIAVLKSVDNGKGPDVLVLNEIEVDHTPDSTVGIAEFVAQHRGTNYRKLLRSDMSPVLRGAPAEAWLAKALEDEGLVGYRLVLGEVQDVTKESIRNVVLSRFPIRSTRQHRTLDSRAIVETRLDLGGRSLYVFANHWKSGAGSPVSERTRMQNAAVLRERLDEILGESPNAEIIVAGDLNTHYNQSLRHPYMPETAIDDVLRAQGDPWKLRAASGADLYNLWYDVEPKDRRTDEFRGEWGTLMHLVISRGLADGKGLEYVGGSFGAIALPGVNVQASNGLPWSWTNYGPGAGLSDHLPIIARFRVVPAEEESGENPLKRPKVDATRPEPSFSPTLDRKNLRSAETVAAMGDEALATAMGEAFRIEGVLEGGRNVRVKVGERTYPIYVPDENLAQAVRALPAGSAVNWIGRLGFHRGDLQFIVERPEWIRKVR